MKLESLLLTLKDYQKLILDNWLLSLSILFVASLCDSINKAVSGLLPIAGFFISFGTYKIANANLAMAKAREGELKYRISEDKKKLIRENYFIVREVLYSISNLLDLEKEYHNTMILAAKAEMQAKLELPKDIEEYTEKLFTFIASLHPGNLAKEEYTLKVIEAKKDNPITKLEEATKVYSNYLKK